MRLDTLKHTRCDGINSTLKVVSLTNPTATNLASETGIRTGLGPVASVRSPRNMQFSARFQF